MGAVKSTVYAGIILAIITTMYAVILSPNVFHSLEIQTNANKFKEQPTITLFLRHVGTMNMNDINFKITSYDCSILYFDSPEISDNNEVKDCKIASDLSSIAIKCDSFQPDDYITVQWKSIEEFEGCNLTISYNPYNLPFPIFRETEINFISYEANDKIKYLDTNYINCTGVCIYNITAIRPFFYSGSPEIIYFRIVSDNTYKANLITEWKDNYGYFNLTYEDELNLTDNYDRPWYVWNHRWYNQKEFDNLTVRIALQYGNNKIEEKNVSMILNYNNTLFNYAKDSHLINWNKTIMNSFLSHLIIDKKILLNDLEKAKLILDLTRTNLKVPLKTQDKMYYDTFNLSSIEVFGKKEGSSSEYAVYYAMLMRILGIPSKVYSDGTNYLVEIYANKSWITINPYDYNSEFQCVACILNNTILLDW